MLQAGEEWWGASLAVPTMIRRVFGLIMAQGTFGARYKPLGPVLVIAVTKDGFVGGGTGLRRVAGGNIKFAGKAKLTFILLFAGPPCQALLTIQSSQPSFLVAPGPTGFVRVAVVTCPAR